MADTPTLDVEQYLAHQRDIGLLRFLTCGSVDDGKSTLIGRLLYESKMIFSDHLLALESDSRRFGTQGAELDFALLVDGLAAEREQGITIDVAYRFFATEKRRFIVADTPGHAQYTRNMVTGASTADLAVILVDARSGLLTQTRRHSYLVALLGIPRVVLAVNKLDLMGYDQQVFTSIADEYRDFAAHIGLGAGVAVEDAITCIPVSALRGDNLVENSLNTPWYEGPSLIEHLERVPAAASTGASGGFRMPVQWVNRPSPDFRG
jgi:bifunctional enzyme CysN/CysC